MPYHTGMKPKNMDKMPSKMKQNMINKTKLHHKTKEKLMKHSNHHTMKHMKMMIDMMDNKKMTFLEAHNKAMKRGGK